MSVKIVRISSGEEIVCSCEVDGDIYKIKKPAILIPTGGQQLGLMPWLAYAELKDNKVKIPEKFIVFITEPKTDLMNEYNDAFGSGLFVPSGGGPVGAGGTQVPSLKISD